MRRQKFFGLIRSVEWDTKVELHWWNWLGFVLAFLGCVAIYWLSHHQAELRLILGAWLNPVFWATFLSTMGAITLGSFWTTRR